MAYFPFYIDIKDKVWIVIGGGNIAFRKVEVLSQFDAKIIVIAPSICKEIYAIQKQSDVKINNVKNKIKQSIKDQKITDEDNQDKININRNDLGNAQIIIHKREFHEDDLKEADFVVAATDDEILNSHISKLCVNNNKLVNVVDVKEECSFIFPAIVKDKELVVAISTGGNSPAAAVNIKKKIQRAIPEYYGEFIELLGEYRDFIKNEVDNPKKRNKVYNELIRIGELSDGNLTFDVIQKIVNQYK